MNCCEYCGQESSTPNFAYHICAPSYIHKGPAGSIAECDEKMIIRLLTNKGWMSLVLDCQDNWAEAEKIAKKGRGVPKKLCSYAISIREALESTGEVQP